MINKFEYFNYCMKAKMPLKVKWVRRAFMTIKDETEHPFIRREGNIISVLIDGEFVILEDAIVDEPVFRVDDEIVLDKESMKCMKQDYSTTLGIAIANSVIIDYGLDGKLEYINSDFTLDDVEDALLPTLKPEPKSESQYQDGSFYPSDVERLSKADLMTQQWAYFFTQSRSKKSLLTPPGLEMLKKKTLENMKKKYGDKLFTEQVHAVEYINIMKDFYMDYFKDDPTLGIVLSPKIVNQSIIKTKVAFGWESNPFNPATADRMILRSLSEGMDLSEEALAYYINSSRAGSYFRGVATQESGTIAKNLVLATMSLKYVAGDCKTDKYRNVLIRNGKRFNGRYILEAGKVKVIEDGSKYEGKMVKMRDPMGCRSPIGTYCNICVGDNAFSNPNAVVLQSTRFGGALVDGDMKKMHGSDTKAILIEF